MMVGSRKQNVWLAAIERAPIQTGPGRSARAGRAWVAGKSATIWLI